MDRTFLWHELEARRDARRRRELFNDTIFGLRRMVVAPGTFDLKNGEERIIPDSRGNRFLMIASEAARKRERS